MRQTLEWHRRRGTPGYVLPASVKDPNRAAALDAWAMLCTTRDVLAPRRTFAVLDALWRNIPAHGTDMAMVVAGVAGLGKRMRDDKSMPQLYAQHLGMLAIPEVRRTSSGPGPRGVGVERFAAGAVLL